MLGWGPMLRTLLAALLLAASPGCDAPPEGPARPERPDFLPLDAGTPDPPAEDGGFPSPTPGTIRVATFNTRLFFDTTCQSERCGPSDFEQQLTPEQFAQKADQLATAVRDLRASVVLLQEIETQESLDALVARLRGAYPVVELGEIGYAGSVDVAVLGAGRLLEVRRHRDRRLTRPDGSTTWFTREFLEVRLSIAGATVVVFDAHFRSKNDDDPGRRLAEAETAQAIVRAAALESPRALVVFGGDLNDTPGSEPLRAVESSGELARVAAELPEAEQATYWYRGRPSAIDHLFLAGKASGAHVPGSSRVARDCPACGYGGSDHAALTADFLLPSP